jgi:hypothetical protein
MPGFVTSVIIVPSARDVAELSSGAHEKSINSRLPRPHTIKELHGPPKILQREIYGNEMARLRYKAIHLDNAWRLRKGCRTPRPGEELRTERGDLGE